MHKYLFNALVVCNRQQHEVQHKLVVFEKNVAIYPFTLSLPIFMGPGPVKKSNKRIKGAIYLLKMIKTRQRSQTTT